MPDSDLATAPAPALVDVDDLYHPSQLDQLLLPLADANPEFHVTCFTIPNKFGPITADLQQQYPWATFAIHGWEHTHFECLEWTYEKATEMLKRSLDMGYAPIFRPPNWICDEALEQACKDLDIILCHHRNTPPITPGLMCWPGPTPQPTPLWIHSHIMRNPATDHVSDLPQFTPSYLSTITKFQTFDEVYITVEEK